MAKLTNDIPFKLENKRNTLAIFCELANIFNTLVHDTLTYIHNKYGLRGTALSPILGYLNNYYMFVKNDDECLSVLEMSKYGVPQGSVLGPLLFILFLLMTYFLCYGTACLFKITALRADSSNYLHGIVYCFTFCTKLIACTIPC